MDLVGENRVFVKKGLELLKTTKNEGLHALMQCTGVDTANLNTYHIGFVIGPCINAGGRLDTAKRALELLNASNRREAVTLAADLKELNDSRKEMTEVPGRMTRCWSCIFQSVTKVSPELLRGGSRSVIIVRPLY